MRVRWRRAELAYWIVASYLPTWVLHLIPRSWRQRRVQRFVEQLMRPPEPRA